VIHFGLASKKRAQSLQAKMASNVDNLTLMMQQMLDKMTDFEAWRATTDTSLGSLLTKTAETATRITHLEKVPIPTPPPPPPPPPPAGWVANVDLNRIPSPGGGTLYLRGGTAQRAQRGRRTSRSLSWNRASADYHTGYDSRPLCSYCKFGTEYIFSYISFRVYAQDGFSEV
jgi:hypothetical protein